MAAVILKLLFWSLSSFIELAIFTLLRGAALIIIAFIQLLRVPGQALNGALEQAAELLRAVGGYVLQLIIDMIMSVIAGFFDLLTSSIAGFYELMSSGIVDLAEKARSGIEELAEIFPELFEDAGEVIGKLILNLWNNYKDALGYVIENI